MTNIRGEISSQRPNQNASGPKTTGHNAGNSQGPAHFANEHRLLAGNLELTSDHPSLLFYTVHKSASDFVGRLLMRIARTQAILRLDWDAFVYNHTEQPLITRFGEDLYNYYIGKHSQLTPEIESDLKVIFQPKGCLYGPFRSPVSIETIPDIDQFRKLLLLRDPRDALTSLYFSVAYSHRVPSHPQSRVKMLRTRQVVRQSEIDEFVLDKSKEWSRKYEHYCEKLLSQPDVKFVKYEDMVTKFPAWLDDVIKYWGVSFDPADHPRIAEVDFNVEQEDIYSHKRQVQPGDHRRKLQPKTIEKLTKKFENVLAQLGYLEDDEAARAA